MWCYKVQCAVALQIFTLVQLSLTASKCPENQGKALRGENSEWCYAYVKKSIIHHEAATWCRSHYKGYLARISDPKELQTVGKGLKNAHTNNVWIDMKCTRGCTWSNGKIIGSKMLLQKEGRSSTNSGSGICGALKSKGNLYNKWTTIDCKRYNPFICQTPAILSNVSRCGKDTFMFDNKCYKLLKTSTTQKASRQSCQAIKGKLIDLSSQNLILAATNYLSMEAKLMPGSNVWVGSVMKENTANNRIRLIQNTPGPPYLMDEHTGWKCRQVADSTTRGRALCQVPPLKKASTSGKPFNKTNSNNSTGRSTMTSSSRDKVDGTVTVIAVMVVGVAAISIAFGVVICCKKTAFLKKIQPRLPKESEYLTPCCRIDENSLRSSNSAQHVITPLRTSESIPNRDVRGRADRVSHHTHSYQQISFDNTYASIDSAYVGVGIQQGSLDRPYAQIDKPDDAAVRTESKTQDEQPGTSHSERNNLQATMVISGSVPNGNVMNKVIFYANLSVSTPREYTEIPSSMSPKDLKAITVSSARQHTELNTSKTRSEVNFPAVSKNKEENPSKQSEVNYAQLQLPADEDLATEWSFTPPTGMHYAKLNLMDEDDKYKEEV